MIFLYKSSVIKKNIGSYKPKLNKTLKNIKTTRPTDILAKIVKFIL